ncbi:S26 family signal peptidase [Streptomyces formicae]|uniref:Signal peptidase I n=1 Tax=Streptomyces formicae TaxID=1616117 RepID=A0A291QN72_9ACTN|nr:S26 family signal peptidase [Streptomyces formicae]ATL32966.1 Signal peptidase I [Streptomyces formicae]
MTSPSPKIRRVLGAVGALGAVLTAAVLARGALVSVTVRGRSMEPAYRDGDRVLVLRLRLRTSAFATGRVIVVERPGAGHRWPGPPLAPAARAPAVADRQWMIKRVGATPGDPPGPPPLPTGPVPPGHLVLLGDNPHHSVDSRQLGYFPVTRVLGVVLRARPRVTRRIRK